jgi:hypothetical protein
VADFVQNISQGRVTQLYDRVDTQRHREQCDHHRRARHVRLETDAVLKDLDTLTALVAGTTNEVTNTGYARKDAHGHRSHGADHRQYQRPRRPRHPRPDVDGSRRRRRVERSWDRRMTTTPPRAPTRTSSPDGPRLRAHAGWVGCNGADRYSRILPGLLTQDGRVVWRDGERRTEAVHGERRHRSGRLLALDATPQQRRVRKLLSQRDATQKRWRTPLGIRAVRRPDPRGDGHRPRQGARLHQSPLRQPGSLGNSHTVRESASGRRAWEADPLQAGPPARGRQRLPDPRRWPSVSSVPVRDESGDSRARRPGPEKLAGIRAADAAAARARRTEQRGGAPAKPNGEKTHCAQGHPYAGDNLMLAPNGARRCVSARGRPTLAPTRSAGPQLSSARRSGVAGAE